MSTRKTIKKLIVVPNVSDAATYAPEKVALFNPDGTPYSPGGGFDPANITVPLLFSDGENPSDVSAWRYNDPSKDPWPAFVVSAPDQIDLPFDEMTVAGLWADGSIYSLIAGGEYGGISGKTLDLGGPSSNVQLSPGANNLLNINSVKGLYFTNNTSGATEIHMFSEDETPWILTIDNTGAVVAAAA